MKSLIFFLTLGSGLFSQAAILSPSSVELKFTYTTEFSTQEGLDAVTLADTHAQHMFGYMQSPALVNYYRINSNTPGIAAPRLPMTYWILSDTNRLGARTIKYRINGVLLVNKKTAKELLKTGTWEIELPADIDIFYDQKCTDPHYAGYGDFWYFWDPFRKGCEYLRLPPMANPVTVKVSAIKSAPEDTSSALDKVRGDNGNGNLFEITTINGFSENAKDPEDDGRISFEQVNEFLREQGFEETIVARYQNRPIHQFDKTVKKRDGGEIHIRITRLLAETGIANKNVTFAKFFKNAVENSDVIIYAGHSGLGSNLDIESLEEKAGRFVFNPRKHQIFFFDGCSTYSYYLTMFEERKSKGKIDILTNGLSSYFAYEADVHAAFMTHLFKVNSTPTWNTILKDMEKPLDGMTFMLSVGSL